MRVAVLDDYHRVFDTDPAIERLRKRVPVDVFTEKLSSLEAIQNYGAVIAVRERTPLDEKFFSSLPGLQLIAQTGNHAYHVDLNAATRAGVFVIMGSSDMAAMADLGASTVELTFALMLAILRRVPEGDRAIRDGNWPSLFGHTLRR
jgi:phosphoglycerate dehydrogenase-like enzyme